MKINKTMKKLLSVVLSLALIVTSITVNSLTSKAADIPDGYTELTEGWTPMGDTVNTTIGTDNAPGSSWNIYVGTSWAGASVAGKDGADGQDTVSVYVISPSTDGEWGIQLGKVFQGLTAGTSYYYEINYTIDGTAGKWTGIEAADDNGEIKIIKGLGTTLTTGQTFTVTGTVCEEPDPTKISEYVTWLATERNLAYQKTAVVSSYKEGSTDYGVLTDGTYDKWAGNYVGVTTPGYFEIDLGQTYAASSIDQVVVWFRNGDQNLYPAKGFKVQFGDVAFDTVATLTEYPEGAMTSMTDGAQYMVPVVLDKDSLSGNVRKVRIQVDDAVTWGTQITEIAVFAENPQAGEEAAPAENAAAVTVSSEKSSTVKGNIKLNITAGENQDGYTYFVYLDDAATAVLSGCIAGTDYTIPNVEAGKHTVKVVSYYNGGTSEGIVSDEVEVKTILSDVTDVSKNFAYGKAWELLAKEDSTLSHGSAEGNGDITNGIISGDDFVCPVKETDGAYYIIDLGKEVDASLIDSVYVWYRVMEPGCAPDAQNSQDIKYSTDKETWTDVASVAGADVVAAREEQGSAPYVVTADVSNAEGTVRYIQIYYPKGVIYGAQVTEIAVFGETGEVPTDPQPTDPQPTDPQPTDPQPTDPQPTDPQPTDPAPISGRQLPWDVEDSYLAGWTGSSATMSTDGDSTVIAIANTGWSEGDNSMWAIQAKTAYVKVIPGTTYTYQTTLVSDKDKEVFVKVTDVNESEIGTRRVALKANEPQTVSIDFIPEVEEIRVIYALGTMGTEVQQTDVNVTVTGSVLAGEEPTEVPTDAPTEKPTEKPTEAPTAAPTEKTTTPQNETTAKKVTVGKTKVKTASKKLTSKKVKISLKKIKNAKKYQVQISTTKKFKKVLVKKTVKKVKFTLSSRKLKNKKKLYVRARAVRVVGKKVYRGKWSVVKKVKIKK